MTDDDPTAVPEGWPAATPTSSGTDTWISRAEIQLYEGVAVTQRNLLKAQRRIDRETRTATSLRDEFTKWGDDGLAEIEELREAVLAQALYYEAQTAGGPTLASGELAGLREDGATNVSQQGFSVTWDKHKLSDKPPDLCLRAWLAVKRLRKMHPQFVPMAQLRSAYELPTLGRANADAYWSDPVWMDRAEGIEQ